MGAKARIAVLVFAVASLAVVTIGVLFLGITSDRNTSEIQVHCYSEYSLGVFEVANLGTFRMTEEEYREYCEMR